MNTPKTAEDFCRFVWHQYLVERRYDILGELVGPELTVIGTGAHEVSRNIEEFAAAMIQEEAEWDGAFVIKNQWYHTTELSDTLSLVIGELVAKEASEEGLLYDVRFRFTMVLHRTEESWKIVHAHQSVPDPNQARDEFFPHRMVEQTSQQIIYNLRHDTMTGLLNRLYLKETATRYMKNQPAGRMLMLDIDQFKTLNDTYGHPFGDKVLILLAQSLKASFPEAAVGRVGGDEFIVYWPGETGLNALEERLDAFQKDWEENQKALKPSVHITVSIGVSHYPHAGRSYEEVREKADEALYKAKKCGGNRACFLP